MTEHIHKPIKHKIDPTEERPVHTICHTHRLLWREADRINSDEIKRLVEIAYDQGVRMQNKLKEYQKGYLRLPPEARKEFRNRVEQ